MLAFLALFTLRSSCLKCFLLTFYEAEKSKKCALYKLQQLESALLTEIKAAYIITEFGKNAAKNTII